MLGNRFRYSKRKVCFDGFIEELIQDGVKRLGKWLVDLQPNNLAPRIDLRGAFVVFLFENEPALANIEKSIARLSTFLFKRKSFALKG